MKGIIIIEPSSSTRYGDLLEGLLFALAHYRALLETIASTPNYVFPSLTKDTHIMGPLNEITRAFHHLSTQLALVGFKAKVSKWKLWNPSRISPSIEIP